MALNMLSNPSFEIDLNQDGLADTLSTAASSVVGSPTYTLVGDAAFGLLCQRVQYTPSAGDVSKNIYLYPTTDIGTVAPGETVTMSVYVRGTKGVNSVISIAISARTAADAYISAPQKIFTLTSSWQRITYTYENLPANTSRVRCYMRIQYAGADGASDIYWDAIKLEKASSASAFIESPFPCSFLG
jgi:hypothetical protein